MNKLPELRQDPIVDRWVMIAPERGDRPLELPVEPTVNRLEVCPFCEGNEAQTPPERFALRAAGSLADGPGWRVRIVPNVFPAARREAESGYGVHEVVVECPRHETSLTALDDQHLRDVFAVYRDRLCQLRTDRRLQYVQIFKNHGAAAGASVEHAHSQILGVARTPRLVAEELANGAEHFRRTGTCIFCDLIARESAGRDRVVRIGEHCAAIVAYAGRFPYETWVLPRRHGSRFEDATAGEIAETADTILAILLRLEQLVDRPTYNLILHTAPLHDAPRADYHWHWEILPRLTGIAGFELASGCFLNPLPPEEAARQLRG